MLALGVLAPRTAAGLCLLASLLLHAFPAAHARDVDVRLLTQGQPSDSALGHSGALTEGTRVASADGRFVAFHSSASNLLTAGIVDSANVQAYLLDRQDDEVRLVSHVAGNPLAPGNGQSMPVGLSSDGRFVFFVSTATDLMAGSSTGSPNGNTSVYVYDRVLGQAQLLSSAAGMPSFAIGANYLGSSEDGRFVLLAGSERLVDPQAPIETWPPQLVLMDRQQSRRVLVSRSASPSGQGADRGAQGGLLSADGRFVLFASDSTDLVSPALSGGPGLEPQVYRFDLQTETVELVTRSTLPGSRASNGQNLPVGISDDGRHVLLSSLATDLMPGYIEGPEFQPQVFQIDLQQQSTRLISASALAPLRGGNGWSEAVGLSPDGRWVLFNSVATDLLAGHSGPPPEPQVYLFDGDSGSTRRISHPADAASDVANSDSRGHWLSPDGAWVLFRSRASNLVPGTQDHNQVDDVFLYDVTASIPLLVTRSVSGASTANAQSFPVALLDGPEVVFSSLASDLVPNTLDINQAEDLFTWVPGAAQPTLLSRRRNAAESASAGGASAHLVSADGRWLALQSASIDLLPGLQGNIHNRQSYLLEIDSGQFELVSRVGANASMPGNGESVARAVSADGRFVAFDSSSSNLDPDTADNNGLWDVFLYDRVEGRSRLLSRSASAAHSVDGTSSVCGMSSDGRYVVFNSTGRGLVAGLPWPMVRSQVYRYDSQEGRVELLTRRHDSPLTPANAASFCTAVSSDGDIAMVLSTATDLTTGVQYLPGVEQVFLLDIATGQAHLASRSATSTSTAGNGQSSAWSMTPDGRYAVLKSWATNLVAGVNSEPQLYLYDRSQDRLSLATPSFDGGGSANAEAFAEMLSNNGRYLVFESAATNLVDLSTEPSACPRQVYVFDRETSSTQLVSHPTATPSACASSSAHPVAISEDGGRIAFRSSATNLLPTATAAPVYPQIYLHERSTRQNHLISRRTGTSLPGNGHSDSAMVVPGDRFLVLASSASDLVQGIAFRNGVFQLYLADLESQIFVSGFEAGSD